MTRHTTSHSDDHNNHHKKRREEKESGGRLGLLFAGLERNVRVEKRREMSLRPKCHQCSVSKDERRRRREGRRNDHRLATRQSVSLNRQGHARCKRMGTCSAHYTTPSLMPRNCLPFANVNILLVECLVCPSLNKCKKK